MASSRTPSTRIRLVVFDLAGTTVDYGSRAPAGAFVELFARYGLTVSEAQARAPMGQHKRDHIRSMLSEAALRAQWRAVRGADWTAADVEALFEEFIPLQMACLPRYADVIPGVADCLAALRERGVAVATTTGYNRAMTDLVLGAAAAQGFVPDGSVSADEVPAGRPAPWMVFACMQRLGVYPPWAVVKVGDTGVDVQEGLNAGAWSVGVAATGNLIGMTASDWAALPAAERAGRLQTARSTLAEAGAHAVLDAAAELPAILADLEARLARGERP
ncbi:MAG: phosphonoacetaldehyde hydrolase [Lentisphaerae bacterium]|nr:phosphonoacetaldehyde hydrolase [Lentisphaerota bacterium]